MTRPLPQTASRGCSVDECGRPHKGRGLCAHHYGKLHRAGAFPKTPDALTRFWARVAMRGPDECWEWTGAMSDNGYGILIVDGAHWRAHRRSWVIAHGAIPDGLQVCHHCDNPPCVNPAHLFLGDQSANILDCVAKGRRNSPPLKGEDNGRAKLTDDQVIAIRREYAAGLGNKTEIAARYGVDRSSVARIISGRRWSHI